MLPAHKLHSGSICPTRLSCRSAGSRQALPRQAQQQQAAQAAEPGCQSHASSSYRAQQSPAHASSSSSSSSVQPAVQQQSASGDAPRRQLLQALLLSLACSASSSGWLARPASAAMVFFPANRLKNDYFLVRAGESRAEAQGMILTNTVYKTNVESGLSKRGQSQVLNETAAALDKMDACASGCWLWPSITERSMQTAEILGALFGLSRSRIVPEFSFLDSRGLGAYEGLNISTAEPQILEGDQSSSDWRPPHGEDGTPDESLHDCLVRVRQVLSITETQWSGKSVILISPDSYNLSVLQCAVLGQDLRSHTKYAFQPGEARELQLATAEEPGFFSSKTFKCMDPPKCSVRRQV